MVRSLRSDLVIASITLEPQPFFLSMRASPRLEKNTWSTGLHRRIRVGDHQANVVPHDFGFLHTKRTNQSVDANRSRFHVQTVGGNGQFSDSGKVWRDYGEALGKQRNDRLPHKS